MRGLIGSVILTGALAMPFVGGCAKTVSERETVTHKRDGTVMTDKATVKEHTDGTRTVEHETSVDRNPN